MITFTGAISGKTMTEQFSSNTSTLAFEVGTTGTSGTADGTHFDAKAMKAALCELAERWLPKAVVPSLRDLPRSLRRLIVPKSFSNFRLRKFPRMAIGVR